MTRATALALAREAYVSPEAAAELLLLAQQQLCADHRRRVKAALRALDPTVPLDRPLDVAARVIADLVYDTSRSRRVDAGRQLDAILQGEATEPALAWWQR